MMNKKAVSVQGLVKRYDSFTAVQGIDIEVGKGEILGLLGPNGAGKTTTLECLEGLRKADEGTLIVAECNPQSDERKLRNLLGVQLQSSSLPDSIQVREAISLFCAYHNLPQREDLIQKFKLDGLQKKQYKELSTGQKRKLHLVLSLINNPEVLILDEPTAGLDVQSRVQLHEEIRNIKSQGTTVLLATHDMAEAEELCDRIAIMIRGKVVVCGTPEQVTAAGSRETRIRIRTSKGSLMPGGDFMDATFIHAKDDYLEWKCHNVATVVSEILNRVEEAADTVEDLRVERPNLEERFIELMEGMEKE